MALILFGLALHLPMVRSGFFADDHFILGQLRPESPYEHMRPWSLYDFGSRDDWSVDRLGESAFPFWTPGDWKIRFFRPLSSLSLALDRALFGEQALAFHLVSLGLYALLLLLVHALYRALGLSAHAALLGLGIFLLGDSTVFPVGWISNRNSLLVAVFGVSACLLVASARRRVTAPTLAVACLLALAAALAKESGAFVFAVLAALMALRAREVKRAEGPAFDRGPRAPLLIALVSATALWLVTLAALGYGTRNYFYASPWDAPAVFVERCFLIGTVGTLSLAGPLPVDLLTTLLPAVRFPAAAVALLLLVPLVIWMRHRVKNRSGAGFLLAWVILFLFPQAGAPVSDRTLFVASIGSAGLLAIFFDAIRSAKRAGTASRFERLLAGTVLLSATIGSGAALVLMGSMNADMAGEMREKALAAEAGSPDDGPRDAFVFQTENGFDAFTLAGTRVFETHDATVAFHLLQIGRRALLFERIAENVFEIESLDEPFLTGLFETVYLVDQEVPIVGTLWQRSFFTVEAITAHETDEPGLRRLRITLKTSLEDPQVLLLVPEDGILRQIRPPSIGASVRLPAPIPANPFMP